LPPASWDATIPPPGEPQAMNRRVFVTGLGAVLAAPRLGEAA